MKLTATLGSATRTVGKLFFALTLLLVAIAAGFGGTALIVYRGLDGGRAPIGREKTERKASNPSQDKMANAAQDESRPRQVAALPSDQPRFTYADNNGGQPTIPAKRERPASSVPVALENPASAVVPSPASNLNDPESRYIVDSRTGRVVGIDGSVGARREEAEERQRLESAPRAVAVQTPMPEVRVASAVVEDSQVESMSVSDSQSLPVRRALPVTTDAASVQSRSFNVAEYLAGGQSRPVLRARPVVSGGARVYRLSDGSQTVVMD